MPNRALSSPCFLFCYKCHSGLWMLMLSLNNKYFIGSVYAGMLWSLGDVTEPFHVNFFDVLKKIHIDYFYAGFCGRERDKTWMSQARVGVGPDKIYFCGSGRGTESCGSGTEKSIPRRSLDWSNDAENSALITINYILKYVQIENSYLKSL